MNRTLPEKIVCTVKHKKNPGESIFLMATFETDFKNNYSSIFGPTDKDGMALLEKPAILHDAAENWKMGLQDYGSIKKCFTGKASLCIMDEKQLKGALDAYELFKSVVDYPSDYKQKIENSIEILKGVDKDSLGIDAHVVPNTVELII